MDVRGLTRACSKGQVGRFVVDEGNEFEEKRP